jgi:hypothetical protein
VSKTGTFTCNFCVSNSIPLCTYKVCVTRTCPAETVLVHIYFSFSKLKEWTLLPDVFRMLVTSNVNLVFGMYVTDGCKNAPADFSSFSVPVCPCVTIFEQLNRLSWNSTLGSLLKFVSTFHFWLKSDHNNIYLHGNKCVYALLSLVTCWKISTKNLFWIRIVYSVLSIYRPCILRYLVFTVRHLRSRSKSHINNVIFSRNYRFPAFTAVKNGPDTAFLV